MLFLAQQSPENPNQPLSTTQPVGVGAAKSLKTILLVDDDPNSLLLLGLALALLKPRPILHHVPNVIQAKDYLLGNFPFSDRATYGFPDLVLLDLRMPIMDGFQFLEWARSKNEFTALPIVVLTDSIDQRELSRAYQLRATSFLVKPFDMQELAGPLRGLLGI